jgi:hypothetical protein
MVRGHIAPHGRARLFALHLLLRRRVVFQTAWQADLSIALMAAIPAVSLSGVLSRNGLLTGHFGQVTATAVIARQDDAGVLVVAHGVSERLLLGL